MPVLEDRSRSGTRLDASEMPTDDHDRALAFAYRYLNPRDRTEAEVRKHLEDHGLEAPAIDRSILSLTEQGYLNDARYARLYCEDKRELEQWGSERIGRGLLARGIASELVDAALGGEARENELGRAVDLIRRRFPSPPTGRDRERALGLLVRKGYGELALEALSVHARGDRAHEEDRSEEPCDRMRAANEWPAGPRNPSK